jgi:hypothetical protein
MAGISNNAVKIAAGAGVVIAAVIALWFGTQSAPPATQPASEPVAAAAGTPCILRKSSHVEEGSAMNSV